MKNFNFYLSKKSKRSPKKLSLVSWFGGMFLSVTLLSVMILFGCNITFSGDFENTPEGNFDFFFHDLENIYSYRDYTFEGDLTLNQIKEKQKQNFLSNPTWKNLSTVLGQVVYSNILDPHLSWIYAPIPDSIKKSYQNIIETKRGEEYDIYIPYFPQARYLDIVLTDIGWFRYTTFPPNDDRQKPVGYIYIKDLSRSMVYGVVDENAKISSSLDSILKEFNNKGVDRVIIDIRSNAGGSAYIAKIIASRFVDRKKKYAIFEEPISKKKTSRQNQYIEPRGYSYFQDKPLVILINTQTCSAGEILLLMLRQSGGPNRVIGTPTHGCPGSTLSRELPNGWIFQVTVTRSYDEKGIDYFKTGIRPDIVQTPGVINDDKVLLLALDTVREL